MKALLIFGGGFLAGAALAAIFLPAKSAPPELGTLREINTRQQARIDQQEREIASYKDPLRHPALSAPLAIASASPSPAKPGNQLAAIASLMETPAMRQVMLSSARKMIEDSYADFIARLHFTPEERERFLHLLTEKHQAEMDFGVKSLKLPADQRGKFAEQEKATREKFEAELREFFNSDADYALYRDYTEQQAQRYELKALAPGMKAIGEPLNDQQEKALGESIRIERKDFHFSAMETPAGMSDAAMELRLSEEARLQQRIATRAASILTPEQLKVFQNNQASQLQMRKAALEMTRAVSEK